MKKIIAVLLVAFTVSNTYACDICGCGSGSNYFGIIPNYNKHYIGIHYRQRSFTSYHLPEGALPGDISSDHFYTYELRVKYNLGTRWHFFASVPVQTFSQSMSGAKTSYTGIGDASLMAAYTVLNSTWSSNNMRQILQIGAGVKLPTGKNMLKDSQGKLNMNLQPGSGSLDIPFALMYHAKLNNWGLNAELNCRINTYNTDNEVFGNRLNTAINILYRKNYKKAAVMPHVGIAFESAGKDFDGVEKNDYSGGRSLNLISGLDVYIKDISIGLTHQHTISSSLAYGRIVPHNGFSLSVGFNF